MFVPLCFRIQSAFTLIELLVVIAILAAMLLPALVKAKARAQQVDRINDLKPLDPNSMFSIKGSGCPAPGLTSPRNYL